jgi:hypothetical protein
VKQTVPKEALWESLKLAGDRSRAPTERTAEKYLRHENGEGMNKTYEPFMGAWR